MRTNREDQTDAYRSVCATHSVPLFHQPWWLDAVCKNWTGVIATAPDGTAALWPVPLEKKLGVTISRNPFLTPYLGPAFWGSISNTYDHAPTVHENFVEYLLGALPRLPVWHVSAAPYDWNAAPFESAGFTVGHRTTYLLTLAGRSETDLFGGLHAQTRRAVRRAADATIISLEPDAAGAMYNFQRITHQRKGARLHHSLEAFVRLVDAAQTRNCGALWVARSGGEIVGAQWSVWDARRCYNLGLARAETEGGKFVAAALLWHAIRHAHSIGLEVFDFEGSSIPSIAQFFARFGGDAHQYLTLQKNDSPLWRLVRRIRP